MLAGAIHTLFGIDATVIRWPVRIGVFLLAVIWVSRTVATRRRYLAETADGGSRDLRRAGAADLVGQAIPDRRSRRGRGRRRAHAVAVRFGTSGDPVPAEVGMSVLEIAERAGKDIEAGCRMGVCGADPIAVLDGASCLVEADEDELNTLRRLGFASNTRMACCARLKTGTVTVNLTPEPGSGAAGGVRPAQFDRSIASVVVVGNGIAGVTAADFVRRGHPECEIHLVGGESHVLYNRMGISRLVYGRSAMTGLSLLAEEWYAENGVTAWLNTIATSVDTAARRVDLGTGDSLVLRPVDPRHREQQCGADAARVRCIGDVRDALGRGRHGDPAVHPAAPRPDAVVAGGGLLGLEAAFALHSLGLQVSCWNAVPD